MKAAAYALQEPSAEGHPVAQLRHGREVRHLCEGVYKSSRTHTPCMLSAVFGCRGRKGRMAFAASFQPAYHFRLLFMSSQMSYPIMGALRHSFGEPWEVRSAAIFACPSARAQDAQQPNAWP